ncbi:MAG TPA: HD domain-containing protein [Micromonosporaceae bacterium]|nr:HD domain-containing protein [Micromonosporaceae bacterium]
MEVIPSGSRTGTGEPTARAEPHAIRPTDRSRGTRWQVRLPWSDPGPDPVGEIMRAHRQAQPHGDGRQVLRAYSTAERMHRGQMRISGEPFITHPLAVTRILADLGMDTTTLVAALLHDTVEDTSYTLSALERDFGSEVALLVDGVTKFDKTFFGDTAEVETIRKMLVRAGEDVRVLIIKIADRLHNMRTLEARTPAARERVARTTLDVLVPLADRLGVQTLKRSLEDSVLAVLQPDVYAEIDAHVNDRPEWTQTLNHAVAAVRRALHRARISADVAPRNRHYYSIWRDTIDAGLPLDHDLPRLAIVIHGERTDCYTALGTLHAMWKPVPGRFKDFIATPKHNLYRSLHTTVVGPGHHHVEFLIRTDSMHHTAEYGIAAHFLDPGPTARLDPTERAEQLAWLRRVVEWQRSVDDAAGFLQALRCDLVDQQIHVFTTEGRPVQLPVDATPVDFAYTLDASLGNACVGATVNGRLAPVTATLHDGDVVEILTRSALTDERDEEADADTTAGPAVEWLDFVRTSQARVEIDRWFSGHSEPGATAAQRMTLGRAAIGLALRTRGRGLTEDGPLAVLATQLGYPDLDALLVAVADHHLTAAEVVDQLIGMVDRTPPER